MLFVTNKFLFLFLLLPTLYCGLELNGMSTYINSTCLQPSTGTAGATFQAALQFFAAQQCLFPEVWPSYNVKDGDSFDFIVVGAGSAGAIIAARLAEVPRWKVLLVEAGDDPPVESIIPGLYTSLFSTKYNWNLTTANNPLNYNRGRMLGGSSSMNAMAYFRGNPADYDLWAANGNDGWDWESVLPYFKKTENMVDSDILKSSEFSKFHSTNGPIRISRSSSITEVSNEMVNAYEEIGFPKRLDFNGPNQLGVSIPHLTANGIRQSTAQGFLRAAKDNLFIAKNTHAAKILFDDTKKKAIGVELINEDGKYINAYASSEIVLSAGVINSPQILLLSGVGPKADLENMGIPLVADLPVGENFSDHYVVNVYVTGLNISSTAADTYFSNLQYLYDRSGPLSRIPLNLIAGFSTENDNFEAGRPDYQFYNYYAPAGYYKSSSCNASDAACLSIANYSQNHEIYVTQIVKLQPKSRGKVSLSSLVPTDKAIINSGLFTVEDDVEGLTTGIERIVALVNTTYFRSRNAQIAKINVTACNDLEFLSHEYWKCFALNRANVWLHGAGTCSMGPDGVVDADAKVKGISSLRMGDMSIVPVIISGNTNACAMMVGEKVADMIKKEFNA